MWQIASIEHSGAVVGPTGHVHLPFHVQLRDGQGDVKQITAVLPASPSEVGDEQQVRSRLQALLAGGWEPKDIVLET